MSFINLTYAPEDEEREKQLYLMSYRMRIFLTSTVLMVLSTAILSLIVLVYIHEGWFSQRQYAILSAIWPWSVNGQGPGEQLNRENQAIYTIGCSATFVLWATWVAWRFYRDVADRGAFFRRESEDGGLHLYSNILKIAFFSFLGSVFFFFILLLPPFGFSSLFVPSAQDSVYVYTMKKCSIMVSGFWLLGFSSILVSICIKHAWKNREGGEKS